MWDLEHFLSTNNLQTLRFYVVHTVPKRVLKFPRNLFESSFLWSEQTLSWMTMDPTDTPGPDLWTPVKLVLVDCCLLLLLLIKVGQREFLEKYGRGLY